MIVVCAGVAFAGGTWAQSEPDTSRFDLVLYGRGLDAETVRVALRTNPAFGEQWEEVGGAPLRCGRTVVVPGLEAGRYLGQDIRENYLAIRITTSVQHSGSVRALYAMPHVGRLDDSECHQIDRVIAEEPQTVRLHSRASYVRPRPYSLSADRPFIDHIEAPVRHKKPGVLEVEWLELLFTSQD